MVTPQFIISYQLQKKNCSIFNTLRNTKKFEKDTLTIWCVVFVYPLTFNGILCGIKVIKDTNILILRKFCFI